jgi:sulfoxide reductase heme-binding subunit YedZ
MLVLGSYGLVLGLLGWMVLRVAMGTAGPNPVNDTLQDLGVYGLLLLLASLAVRPLVQTKGWRRLLPLRKAFGLQGFALVSLHVLIYLGLDQGFEFDMLLEDFAKRLHIRWGILAFFLLLPLAVTSHRYAQRKLGKTWKKLHTLAYPAIVLSALHAWLAPKTWEPLFLATLLLAMGLLVIRWKPVMQRLQTWTKRTSATDG